MTGWTETYRAAVKAWECDAFAHLTIAYYFDKLGDATAALLVTLGADPAAWQTKEVVTRYLKEFRAGDGFYAESALLAAGPGQVRVAHRMKNSVTGEVTTVAEAMLVAVALGTAPPRLPPATVEWEGLMQADGALPEPKPPEPKTLVPSGRDRVNADEVDLSGGLSLSGYVHRFSGCSMHILASFGMTPDYMRSNRRGFATFETRLRLETPPAPPGTLTQSESGILQIGGSSIRVVHRISEVRSGTKLATFYQSGVQLDLDARRSAPWPDAMRETAQKAVTGDQ